MKFRSAVGPLVDNTAPWGYSPPRDQNGQRPDPELLTDRPEFYGYINPMPFLDGVVQSTSESLPVMISSGRRGIYEGPSVETDRIARAISGQPYYSIAEAPGDWHLIVFPSSDGPASGWINANSSPAAGEGSLIVETEGLPVMIGAGTSTGAVASAAGRDMRVWDRQRLLYTDSQSGSGCSENWYEIPLADNASRTSGWICGDDVNVLGVGGCPDCGGGDLANLVVDSIDSPSSVQAGERLNFDFVVAELNDPDDFNQSVRTVPFDMEYYLLDGSNRILVGDRTNPTNSLWPTSRERDFSGRADIPAGLAPGTYEIVVEVDTDDEVAESNENDNDRSFTVQVQAGSGGDLANLVVDSIDSPSSVQAGERLNFDFVVAELNDPDDFNQSVRTVPFDMEYYLLDGSNRILVGDRTNPTNSLWPTSRERDFSGRADIPAGLAPGTYEIVVEVDTDDEVAESNENDNDRSFTVQVEEPVSPAIANLVVQSINSPPAIEAGERLRFSFVVAELNDPADFEQSVRTVQFDMKYYLLDGDSRVRVGSRKNPPTKPWPSNRERVYNGTANIPAGLASGTYEIVVETDTDDEVAESDESDNARSFTVEITAGTQVTIAFPDSSLSFGAVGVGQSRDLGFRVSNTGSAPLTFSAALKSGSQSFSVIGSADGTVSAGGQQEVQIQFAPGDLGLRTDTLLVSHNASNAPSPLPFSISGTGRSTDDLVDISLADVTGEAGQLVLVPITLSSLDGQEVIAYQFELEYDPEVAAFQAFTSNETLSSGWSVNTNELSTGELLISGANAQPVTGDGTLLYLLFELVSNGVSELDVRSARLNEGDPLVTVSNGSITVGSCGRCGDVSANGDVSSLDAAYVLQYSVGTQPPTFAACAADPSQSGDISPLDASYILQYTVGLRSELSCASSLAATPGEVASSGASLLAAGSAATWSAAADTPGTWTVALSANYPALSAALDVRIDGQADIALPEGSLPNGWVSSLNRTESGARIAFAGAEPLPEGWTIAFSLVGVEEDGLSIAGSLSMDEQTAIELSDLALKEATEELALATVFPNPATAQVAVTLSLPEPSTVRVELFDLLGRLVLVAEDSRLEEGAHTIEMSTRHLAPGGYLVAITTDNERLTRSLTITR